MGSGLNSGIALVFALTGIDCVKDGDVDDGHGSAGAAGAELFAKGAVFAGSYGGVIQTGGIDRDFVPAVDWLIRKFFCVIRVICRLGVKERSVGLTEIARWPLGEGKTGDRKRQQQQEFHGEATNVKVIRFYRPAKYLACLRTEGKPEKPGRKELFPTQCDDDFLLSSNKDYVPIFDSLDRDLMYGSSDLQSELLTFTHYSAIYDGVAPFRIENNA